jgi:hypothetical protein
MGDIRNSYTVLVGKPEAKRSLGSSRLRWEILKETGCEDLNWIQLAQERLL